MVGFLLVTIVLATLLSEASTRISEQLEHGITHARAHKKPKKPRPIRVVGGNPAVVSGNPAIDIRSPGEGENLLRTKTVSILAEVIGQFRNVFYDIDGMEFDNSMERLGSTDLYVASWTIIELEGSHVLHVMAADEDGWGALEIVSVSMATVNVVANYEAEIWYEIDYLRGHAPTTYMLNYWANYWDSRAIIAHPIIDDEISDARYVILDHTKFWEIEGLYNDNLPQAPGNDQAQGNVENGNPYSQEKWILWGDQWYMSGLGGFTYVWRSGLDGQAGNYMFINDGGLVNWETNQGLTNGGGRMVALMHEVGHSIGIIIFDANINEVYDPDFYSVMAIIRANYNANLTNLWYYSHEYWGTRNLEYY